MPSPTGTKLKDGHPTIITFGLNTTFGFWEQTVKPMGIDGREPIPQTNMRNSTWTTQIGRALKTATAMRLKGGYDEKIFSDVQSMCNVNQQITVTFPTGRTIIFYGFLRSWEPDDLAEGVEPTAQMVIEPSNVHPTTGAETGPTVGTTSSTTTTTTTTP